MKIRLQGGFVVAFNGSEHEILERGCVVYEGDRILYVGTPDAPGCPAADRVIDLRGHLVSPGLINFHCIANIDLQPLRIDVGAVGFPRSRKWLEDDREVMSDEDFVTSARFSVAALLRHGSTTFCGVTTMASKRYDDPVAEPRALAQAAEELGARAYIAHNFQDHSRYDTGDGTTRAVHDAESGRRGLQRAIALIEELERAYPDRIRGFMFPYTTETCSDELLAEASRAARDLGVPVRSHFAQYPAEARALLEREGLSPVERLDRLGVLGPELTLTHAIFLRGHRDIGGGSIDADLALLSDTGTSVAHCPVVFSRRGVILRSFERYRRAGINLALGTDTVPPDLVGEMRMASTLAKVADGDACAGSAASVYHAATIGAARALGRDDLGRLAAGAKADISVFRLSALHLGVIDCPIKALVHYASGGDTAMVVVDGRVVVEDGRVVAVDEDELLADAQRVWGSYKESLAARDPAGRSSREMYPRAVAIHHG
jgi:5-methylthioadenosine/S-adenosylhomocysteine deaminase